MILGKNYDYDERVLVFVVLGGLNLALKNTEVMSIHLFFPVWVIVKWHS